MADNNLKIRYITIRLDIVNSGSNENTTFSDGTTTKFVYGYSGSPITQGMNSAGYAKIDCFIQAGIGSLDNVATIKIFGMNIADINSFTRTNLAGSYDIYTANQITIYAGYNLNSDGLPPLVYSGGVIRSAPDYNITRDRPLIIKSIQNFAFDNINVLPTNIKGTISLDNLFRFICNKQGNLVYQGYNVKGNAYNPIASGSVYQQLEHIANKYGYKVHRASSGTFNQNVVYIAPKNSPFKDSQFILSAQNGMIGFPNIEDFGFSVKTYFNPNILIGQKIQVHSESVPYINNKDLYVNQMTHDLHNREEPFYTTLQLNTYSASFTGALG